MDNKCKNIGIELVFIETGLKFVIAHSRKNFMRI